MTRPLSRSDGGFSHKVTVIIPAFRPPYLLSLQYTVGIPYTAHILTLTDPHKVRGVRSGSRLSLAPLWGDGARRPVASYVVSALHGGQVPVAPGARDSRARAGPAVCGCACASRHACRSWVRRAR